MNATLPAAVRHWSRSALHVAQYTAFRARERISGLSHDSSFVVCAIARDEGPYIDEWVRYHLTIGVDHIYVYDNDERSPLARLMNDFPGRVTVVPYPGHLQQLNAYNDFLHRWRGKHRWAAFIDIDEFLVLRGDSTWHEFLSSHCARGALALNWVMFDSNGQSDYIDAPVLERFTRRQRDVSRVVKVIARTDDALYMSGPHTVRLARGATLDCHGREVTGAANPHPSDDVACVHHYFTKSYAEFLAKCQRGRGDIDVPRDPRVEFVNYINGVTDTSALDALRGAR